MSSIATERLTLKPTTVEDAAFILELLNSPKWLEFIGDRNVKSVPEAEAYIKERMLPQFERLGFTNNVVIRKNDGKKIGACGLYDRDGLDSIDIGFAFLPGFEGQGYGFESASALLQTAFKDYNLNRVIAITSKRNIPSQKLLQKIGLSFERMITLPYDNEELMLFAIDK
jgi:RimJ/RimL family protein N-acetyltransferase